jgi:hypothetical protein
MHLNIAGQQLLFHIHTFILALSIACTANFALTSVHRICVLICCALLAISKTQDIPIQMIWPTNAHIAATQQYITVCSF